MACVAVWLNFSRRPPFALFLAFACGAGIYFCNWWLHIRLICLDGNRSAIGAIFNVDPQTPSYNAGILNDYDTDYCFNLLIYPAIPLDMLPNSFVNDFSPPQAWQASATSQLQANWSTLFPTISWDDANLILPQQTQMGSLGLGFTGQYVCLPEPHPACLSCRLSSHHRVSPSPTGRLCSLKPLDTARTEAIKTSRKLPMASRGPRRDRL
jgi:hypothetical protein